MYDFSDLSVSYKTNINNFKFKSKDLQYYYVALLLAIFAVAAENPL